MHPFNEHTESRQQQVSRPGMLATSKWRIQVSDRELRCAAE